jgi:hypothetical protein
VNLHLIAFLAARADEADRQAGGIADGLPLGAAIQRVERALEAEPPRERGEDGMG